MEQRRNRWIFVLIILQPVIDLITSLTTKYANAAISLGALFKMILMVFLFFYLLLYFWKEKRRFLPFFLLSYAAIVAMLVITVIGKPNIFFFAEMNFAFKTAFYLTLLFTVIMWYLRKIAINALLYRAVTIVSLVIGVTYWIAVLTGTSINSYTYVKPGYSGWFYSANELSVTVIVLLALSLLNVFENAKGPRNQGHPIWTDWLAFLLMVSMIPMVGTKTAYAGGILLLLFYGAALIIRTRFFFWRERRLLQLLLVGMLFVLLIPYTPAFTAPKHLQPDTEAPLPVRNTEADKDEPLITNPLLQRVLSARDVYFQETSNDYGAAVPARKLFGLGYAGDYADAPKLIEMDFFDLFFGYGIIGTLLLLFPMIYLAVKLVRFPLTIEKSVLLLTIAMCLGISFLAGHVLLAPAVMSYVAILLMILSGTYAK